MRLNGVWDRPAKLLDEKKPVATSTLMELVMIPERHCVPRLGWFKSLH